MTVTFCGHRDFYGDEEVKHWLRETVEGLILRGADDFLLGGYGAFDACAASVVRDLKRKYIRCYRHKSRVIATWGATPRRQYRR